MSRVWGVVWGVGSNDDGVAAVVVVVGGRVVVVVAIASQSVGSSVTHSGIALRVRSCRGCHDRWHFRLSRT